MRNLKHTDVLFLLILIPFLLAGCLPDSPGPIEQLLETKTGHITITKTAVPDVANESVGIVEFSSVAFDIIKPSEIYVADQTVPCNKLGFGGTGTVIVTGLLRNPGDMIKLAISDCSYRKAPIGGNIDITLVSHTDKNYMANYNYSNFVFGKDANALTMNGDVSIDSSYDEEIKKTVIARTTKNLELVQGAKSAKVTEMWCADSYINNRETGPYEVECTMVLTSSAFDGCVALETTRKFEGIGSDKPTAGEILISGAIDTKTLITAQPDGKHAMIQWDSDGDGVYEGRLLKKWDDMESDMLNWVVKML